MISNFATEIFKINIRLIIRSLTVAARIMDQTNPQPSNRAADRQGADNKPLLLFIKA